MELHRVHRRSTAIAVTALAAAALALVAAPVARAVEDVETDRIAGQDRFGTAAEIATAAFPNGAGTVLVASGRSFPDALAGAVLGFPVLLTEQDSLPDATSDALAELEADRVIILGGTAAVSSAVEAALEGDVATVDRIAGATRYETAAEIAEAIGADQVADLDGKATAVIATGTNFADALAGGPVAAAGAGDGVHPILLTNTSVPDATGAALEALDIEQVVILGGTGAVPKAVADELEDITGNPPVRIAGSNRFATAVEVAETAIEDFDFPADEILLANGLSFADALAGGPLGAVRQAPIILTDVNTLPGVSEAFFEDHADTVEQITALGGTAAVSGSVLGQAEQAAEREDPPVRPVNETLIIDPQGAADVANGSSREYSVTGLTSTIDIVLVECGSITRGTANTNTTFRNANGNGVADHTAQDGAAPDHAAVANAHISSVNGTGRSSVEGITVPNNDYANDVAHTDGEVTFVVTGPAADSSASVCVQPVVFVDANVDNALNVASGTTTPNEQFAVGGATTFSRGAAAAGQFGAHDVATVDKAGDRFTACAITGQQGSTELVDSQDCKTFRYDANDVFQISSQTVPMATWEQALSVDDDVQGTYAVDTAGQSTFNLLDEDSSAGTPTITSATASSADGTVSVGDTHELVFSEAMSAATATGSYTVAGSNQLPSELEIDCGDGGNASCVLTSANVLRATITTAPPPLNPPTYPLEITGTAAMTDTSAAAVNLNEGDTTIEVNAQFNANPSITAARMLTDTASTNNFGSNGDVLELTFSENVTEHVTESAVTVEQLRAILGRPTIAYNADTVVTLTVSGAKVTITVATGSLQSGVDTGQVVDGSSNSFIRDTSNNPQQANPTADPTLQPAS